MLVEFLLAQCTMEPPAGYAGMVIEAAEEFNIDARLLNTVVVQESGCNARAIGGQNEIGLVQLHPVIWSHPYNWNWLSTELTWNGLEEAWKPEENLRAGAWLLSINRKLANGDLRMSLTMYNGSEVYADQVISKYEIYWEEPPV
jgi:soluble lytic murein transglycosylase-like protein